MPPPPEFGANLVEYLFELGPVKKESPIEPPDIPGWEHVLGVEFEPWQSRLLLQLSRAYHQEMHGAREWHAPPPWTPASKQWQWVRGKQSEENVKRMKAGAVTESAEVKPKGKSRNGNRQ